MSQSISFVLNIYTKEEKEIKSLWFMVQCCSFIYVRYSQVLSLKSEVTYVTPVLQAFAGNSNTESVVRHDLQNPIVARYLRIIPLDWSEEGRIGLRFEIYGCPYCKLTLHYHIPQQISAKTAFCGSYLYDAEYI